ncbi:MAG: hypothetical protein K2O99_08605 [Lachnospiraceae bacterium]|nr:hypothetical protein [Lachnospiraceae bacterium]
MIDLKDYVDELFRHQRLTPEVRDLKEEILSNMTAKMEDLTAQGIEADVAAKKAKESLTAIDCLIDANQLTDITKYHLECTQTVLLNCIIFWIFSLPLLFTHFATFSYLGLLLTITFAVVYLLQTKQQTEVVAFLSITASERRKKIAWIVWGLFFAVCAGTMAALTFGSDIWFGRPLNISGPYQMANIAVRFYMPLLTILIPVTVSSFTKLLLKNRKGHENE